MRPTLWTVSRKALACSRSSPQERRVSAESASVASDSRTSSSLCPSVATSAASSPSGGKPTSAAICATRARSSASRCSCAARLSSRTCTVHTSVLSTHIVEPQHCCTGRTLLEKRNLVRTLLRHLGKLLLRKNVLINWRRQSWTGHFLRQEKFIFVKI